MSVQIGQGEFKVILTDDPVEISFSLSTEDLLEQVRKSAIRARELRNRRLREDCDFLFLDQAQFEK